MLKGTSEGSVYYIKSRNRWIAQYYEFDYTKNKTIAKRKTFGSKEEAEKYLACIMYQKSNPLYIKHNGIPLQHLMRANLQFKLDINQISETQYARVTKTIDKIAKSSIADTKIDVLTSEEIQDYLNSLKDLSNSYIFKIYSQFSSSFKYAMKKGYIYKNPMDDVIMPKSKKPDKVVRALTFEEEQKFLNFLETKTIEELLFKNVFYIQLFLGLRIGEVLALRVGDIDLVHNFISISSTLTLDKDNKLIMGGKTKIYAGTRKLPIPKFLKPIIIEQLDLAIKRENKELFLTNGKLVRPTTINRILKQLLAKLNIYDISTHSLRHTYGTRCIEAGMAPVVLQKLMGHKGVSVTLNTYTSVYNEYKERELEKVNEYYINNNLINNNNLTLNEYNPIQI